MDPPSSVRHLLPTAPPGTAASQPNGDGPRLMAKSRDCLRVGVSIRAPRTKLQRARERTERRRAACVRRRPRGEHLAVSRDELEVLAARGLQTVGRVRVVRAREGLQECAGRWRRVRCVGGI